MADSYFAAIEVNGGYQPVFATTKRKDDQIPYSFCRRKRLPQFIEAGEITLLHDLEPASKRTLAVRISSPELLNCFA